MTDVKTYAVCIDGTWNHPFQTDRDPRDRDVESVTETNVLRVFRFLTGERLKPAQFQPIMHAPMLPRSDTDKGEDVGMVLYLSGIGTDRGPLGRKVEGFTGTGTRDRILSAYKFLAEHCQTGDRIFGFGFSRGAFAVRALAGLVHRVGLPAAPRSLSEHELEQVGRAYWHASGATSAFVNHRSAEIQFLGLWDTVGALMFDGALGRADISPPNVRHVAHALALDEKRAIFDPEFWSASGSSTQVDEVWFAGAHSNIGGGYEDPELSNIALAWVVSKAAAAKLPAHSGYIRGWHSENTFAFARNSYDEFFRHFRIISALMKGARPRVIREGQGIHASVFDRVEMLELSEYVTGPRVSRQEMQQYMPTAVLANGQGFPAARGLFASERVVETPDYLSKR